ncbi:MAG: proteasome assembly chaperone family protein [Candidatus Limnocylindria bacterium]
MSLYTLSPGEPPEARPDAAHGAALVAAFDGWVDSGAAATTAAQQLLADAVTVASFDPDALYDYRARRPTLDIVDGRIRSLAWPELHLRRTRVDGRDLFILTGPEPDDRWRAFGAAVVELARHFGIAAWISLGAIPAAVPHTRAVPIIGTASDPALLRGDVLPGPAGLLRVPAAAISVLEHTMIEAGFPAVGYFAQVPHYVSGPYPGAAVELLSALGRHLGVILPAGALVDEARQLRTRLDTATALEESTRAYVERLEAMVDEQRLPSGDELIGEIERFLREGGTEGPGQRQN